MKLSQHLAATLACTALLTCTTVQGQHIWRCGPQGNSFSDRPCPDGQALAAAPAPSAAAVQEAVEVARREAALASRLRAERLAQEQAFALEQAALRSDAARERRHKARAARSAHAARGDRAAHALAAADADAPTKTKATQRAHAARAHADGAPSTHLQGLRVAAAPAPLRPKAK